MMMPVPQKPFSGLLPFAVSVFCRCRKIGSRDWRPVYNIGDTRRALRLLCLCLGATILIQRFKIFGSIE
ncbi:hypothetical protein DMH17_06715 [Raoultella planticola]|nr:hypothetical protein [Raoultella planticola]